MSTDQILSFVAEHPRCTAKEVGTTTAIMNELEAQGKVVNVGPRLTGGRGRPSHEWTVPGVVVEQGGRTSGVPGAPALMDIGDVRSLLSDEDMRIVEFIESVWDRPGARIKDDMKLLANTYRIIYNRYSDRKVREETVGELEMAA